MNTEQERECPNCGGDELRWGVSTINTSGATDGRLCMREIDAVFVLGCEECSETIRTVRAASPEGQRMLDSLALLQSPKA